MQGNHREQTIQALLHDQGMCGIGDQHRNGWDEEAKSCSQLVGRPKASQIKPT